MSVEGDGSAADEAVERRHCSFATRERCVPDWLKKAEIR